MKGDLSLGGHPIQNLLSKRPQDVIFCGKLYDHTVIAEEATLN